MVRPEEIRIGNIIYQNGELIIIDEDQMEVLMASRNWEDHNPVKLNDEVLKSLGFELIDQTGFRQYKRKDFIIVQFKIEIIKGFEMPYTFVIKSSIQEALNFEYAHHLQNTYYDLKGELMIYEGNRVTNR